jgi:hypothetical protein
VFCFLLLVPILILSYVQSKQLQLTVVAVFILLSTFLSSFMASASHKPGLAIVAGQDKVHVLNTRLTLFRYAAILVVFLSGSPMYGEK